MAKRKGKPDRRSDKGQPKSAGNTLTSYALFPILVSLIGLIVAFGLIWWQVIRQPQAADAQIIHEQTLANLARVIDARLEEQRQVVNAMANSPEVIQAMNTANPAEYARVGAQLTALHPFISRVDLIEKGQAEVDLNAAIPISFAALDLIRRAETKEFVGPEVSLNQRNMIYTAQPITPQGAVAGVLLVVFDANYFLHALNQFSSASGQLEIQQKFEGAPSTVVMQWGTATDPTAPKLGALAIPHWTLSYAASKSAIVPPDRTASLFLPFGVSLLVLLGAIFLGLSRLFRHLNEDADSINEYASRLLRGRSSRPESYHLAPMTAAAKSLANVGGSGGEQARSDTDSDDLLAGLGDDEDDADTSVDAAEQAAKPKPQKPKAKKRSASEAANDFLEVSKSADDNFGIEVSEEEGPASMGLDIDPEIFRAYDIRGITTSNLTEEVVYWIARAFAAQARSQQQHQVALGWDGRHSSNALQASVKRGLTEGGVDVLSIGQVPTPVLYYATYALDTGTGIMITGSHNPPEYNGLKMMIAGVTLAEETITTLYRRIASNDFGESDLTPGDIDDIALDDSYIDRIADDVALAQPPKVVVDCGNGVAGKFAPRLLQELGCDVVPLYCDVDGDFPNHHPDPADPKNLEDLITVVNAESADIGLAFDGDGDRLGIVTNSGEIIWPDKLLMLFAQDIVSRNPGADIIYDVKCSRHLNTIISELGGRPIMWKTGHSHIKAKIKESGALLGGEFSGHICFNERWYGFDDALYSAARLLEIIASDGRSVDEIFGQFPVTFTTPELKINTTEAEKFEIVERLAIDGNFGDGTITTIDGIRVDYPDSWGLIRPSNTSPVLSLRFEADGPAALDRVQDEFQAQLAAIDPKLKFRG